MRPAKPQGIKSGHFTKSDKEFTAEIEKSLLPNTGLPKDAPSLFKFEAVKAETVYKRLMKHYSQLDAVIVTVLDRDLLVNYCNAVAELSELMILRKLSMGKFYSSPSSLSINDILALDSRIDRKKSIILTMAQSLYLTPRARAGVAPEKKKQKDFDPFDEFLNDIETTLNTENV
jgi:phage terminase small subunit